MDDIAEQIVPYMSFKQQPGQERALPIKAPLFKKHKVLLIRL